MNAAIHLKVVKDQRLCDDRRNVPRPCTRTDCRHNLVGEGSTKESCALDVADRGEHSLEEVGEILGITRERVSQIINRLARDKPHLFVNALAASPLAGIKMKAVRRCRCGNPTRMPDVRTCEECNAKQTAREPKCPCANKACTNLSHRPKEYCASCHEAFYAKACELISQGHSTSAIVRMTGMTLNVVRQCSIVARRNGIRGEKKCEAPGGCTHSCRVGRMFCFNCYKQHADRARSMLAHGETADAVADAYGLPLAFVEQVRSAMGTGPGGKNK
jgi:hypothetical protein